MALLSYWPTEDDYHFLGQCNCIYFLSQIHASEVTLGQDQLQPVPYMTLITPLASDKQKYFPYLKAPNYASMNIMPTVSAGV